MPGRPQRNSSDRLASRLFTLSLLTAGLAVLALATLPVLLLSGSRPAPPRLTLTQPAAPAPVIAPAVTSHQAAPPPPPAPESSPAPPGASALEPPAPKTQPADASLLAIAQGDEPPAAIDRSSAARRRATTRFGGTPRTEDAVELGLAWLAAHQEPDGTWDRFGFHRQCPANDRCSGVALNRAGPSLTPGLTGLCLLAFLGAGYTDREGPYPRVVGRAVYALLRRQDASGGFSPEDAMAGYNNALATFALAEYYAMTREPLAREPLQRAVDRLVSSQQPQGGWDYSADPRSGRNDTSITSWAVQALQAAASCGLRVPEQTLIRAALHFERATEADGRVWYSDAGTGFSMEDLVPRQRYGPAMLAAGLSSAQLLGMRMDSPRARAQRALLLAELPSAITMQGRDPSELHDYYYWYYGAVAAFQLGAGTWERWNASLRDALLPLQERPRGGQRAAHATGSWRPYGPRWGKWGRMGSRVYTTAISVLTLEVYYRHPPAYLEGQRVLSSADWRQYLAQADGAEKRLAFAALTQCRLEIGEPVLVELLESADPELALAAAEALADIDNPLGANVLNRALPAATPAMQLAIQRALRRIESRRGVPRPRGVVRVVDAELGMATLLLPGAYCGLDVSVQRGESPIAEMRVVQRFSGQDIVVARVVAGAVPEPRDSVIAVLRP